MMETVWALIVDDNSRRIFTICGDKIIDFDARITWHRNMAEQMRNMPGSLVVYDFAR